MPTPAKPALFKKGLQYVAVAPIRRSSSVRLLPGDEIPDGVSLHILMYWHKCGWIGPTDHPWTERILSRKGVVLEAADPPVDPPADPKELAVVVLGGGWFSIQEPDGTELEKVQGSDDVDAWLTANNAIGRLEAKPDANL